jgi:hypothetical protein
MKNIENLTSPTRERTSVPISGLDLSTPDDLVKDGKCETLHNMRFNAEAWRPVHRHRSKTVTLETGDKISGSYFTILYKHPVDNEGVYIARRKWKQANDNTKYIICRYDTSNSTYTDLETFDALPKISHFGNVLIFSDDNTSTKYLYKDGTYQLINFPNYADIEIMSADYSNQSPKYVLKGGTWALFNPDTDFNSTTKFDSAVYHIYNVTQGISLTGGGFMGEILLFTSLRMDDGTSISLSPIRLIKTHGKASTGTTYKREIGYVYNGRETDADRIFGITYSLYSGYTAANGYSVPKSDLTLRSASFALRVRVPENIDTTAIKSIAVWTTRINPTYEWSKKYEVIRPGADNSELSISDNFTDYYAKFDFNQPFYLFEEIYIKDMAKETSPDSPVHTGFLYKDIFLTGESLNSAIYNEVYTPENNIHDIISSDNSYDYNDSCHYFAPTLRLATPYSVDSSISNNPTISSMVKIPIDGHTYNVQRQDDSTSVVAKKYPFTHLISYPDYRAKEYLITGYNSFLLSECAANNFAYYHAPHSDLEKFPPISDLRNNNSIELPNEDSLVTQPSRIQVSKANNIFSLPFGTSYNVGNSSNRIIAMQSAAIKIGDEQVGALPLYVFTEEGIYALRAGESTLYSAVNPINHDRIINPSTISVNGAVAYITERGVHILTGEGSKVISTPIHGADGIPDINFLKSCVFLAPKQFNEIVLLDGREAGTKTHYVYNLDYGYWSTRELEGEKINTDELVDNAAGIIYDLNDEDEDVALGCKITTRPIKLGNVEYKRLETIIPRMRTTNDSIKLGISLEASNDGRTYVNLYKTDSFLGFSENINNPLVIRRVPFSAKYFKLQLNLKPENEDWFATSITHIDFEWYMRFSRRMR